MFSWDSYDRPILALAPMAGVTDASYRMLIKELAPTTIVYTELLSTDALHYGAKKTLAMMHFDPTIERPFIVQVFGKRPEHFLDAAKVVEQMGADGIDINMGCPASKVVSSCHGAALIKSPQLAAELVQATKKSVSIPVSVKTRLGWDSADHLIDFCRGLIDAGADALAIHGRRYCDKFTGSANWEPIYALKSAFPHVPILGNGDIASPTDAINHLKNLDGVMVGRATVGNPWLMRDIEDALHGLPIRSRITELSFTEKIPFILRHCELAVQTKAEGRGMREMRRHLAAYVRGIDGAAELRSRLVRVESVEEVKGILGSNGK